MADNELMVVDVTTEGGEVIHLTPDVVRNYLCPGQKIADSEMVMFLQLCRAQNLNPFLREAYIIKYGDYPASIVVGKETFTKRANRNPQFDGYEVSVDKGNGDDMTATAKVYRKDMSHPFEVTVYFEEYCGKTFDRDKKLWVTNKQWASKPKTMLRKVALVQALREAFPTDFAGMYSEEEMDRKPYEDAIDITPPERKSSVQPKAETKKEESTEQEKLLKLLTEFCDGKEDAMTQLLYTHSFYENGDKTGYLKLADLKQASTNERFQKWCHTTRKKMEEDINTRESA